MGEPFMGEIKIIPWEYAPRSWAYCDGATLSVQQNAALFALLGNAFGGDGVNNFALPNLQGRTPIHQSSTYTRGSTGGEAAHQLLTAELPSHSHQAQASSASANTGNPASNIPAQTGFSAYASSSSTTLLPASVGNAGGGQAHENQQPYTVLGFIISLAGIFPSRP